MSSAEPAVSTPGDNESDTTEQGRSEASSSSQDTSPTNETSREGEDAPVENKKHKYIKWTNKTDPEQRFRSRYPKEWNELKGRALLLVAGYV